VVAAILMTQKDSATSGSFGKGLVASLFKRQLRID
jgi:hypothetical protein